jgi:thymidine kinase
MHCCDEASFTKKIMIEDANTSRIETDDTEHELDNQIDIGGAEKYIAVCRKCLWELDC